MLSTENVAVFISWKSSLCVPHAQHSVNLLNLKSQIPRSINSETVVVLQLFPFLVAFEEGTFRVQPMFGQTQNVGYTRNILQMFDCCLYYGALCAKLEDGPFVSQCSNRDILVIWEFLLILSPVSLFNKPTNWVAPLWLPKVFHQALCRQCICVGYVRSRTVS